mmetsp:Transcript_3826/g.16240  ORF Transcript_3826/g.16240 Transcript_3826/m.16240 type:complete len:253 (-) Transcript_3826:610-1368(-)
MTRYQSSPEKKAPPRKAFQAPRRRRRRARRRRSAKPRPPLPATGLSSCRGIKLWSSGAEPAGACAPGARARRPPSAPRRAPKRARAGWRPPPPSRRTAPGRGSGTPGTDPRTASRCEASRVASSRSTQKSRRSFVSPLQNDDFRRSARARWSPSRARRIARRRARGGHPPPRRTRSAQAAGPGSSSSAPSRRRGRDEAGARRTPLPSRWRRRRRRSKPARRRRPAAPPATTRPRPRLPRASCARAKTRAPAA